MKPPSIKPMMATSGPPPPAGDWVLEPKLDGIRSIVRVHEGTALIASRNGIDVTECYPEIGHLPHSLTGVSAVFDGEIVALGAGGLPDFQRLQQRMNRRRPTPGAIAAVPLAMFVFDLLWLDGVDLTRLPLQDRRARLEQFTFDRSWQLTPRLAIDLTEEVIDSFLVAGLEGVMVKSPRSIYRPGERTTAWIKVKARHRARAVICGYLRDNARTQIGSLALGMYDDAGALRYIGQIGNSLPHAQADQLEKFLRTIEIPSSPFVDLESDSLVYVEPHVVVELAYTEATNAGTLRQPILRSVLIGAPPSDAVMSSGLAAAVASRTKVRLGGGQRL